MKKNHASITVIKKLIAGEWIDGKELEENLGLTFNECFQMFDFSRTVEWWSICGKTEEERERNGQKVICKFRLKANQ